MKKMNIGITMNGLVEKCGSVTDEEIVVIKKLLYKCIWRDKSAFSHSFIVYGITDSCRIDTKCNLQ